MSSNGFTSRATGIDTLPSPLPHTKEPKNNFGSMQKYKNKISRNCLQEFKEQKISRNCLQEFEEQDFKKLLFWWVSIAMKKILVDEEKVGQEISCINVIYNRYLKSPWPDVNEEYERTHGKSNDLSHEGRYNAFGEQKVLPPTRKTNPCIWCIALMCSLIAIAIVLSGLAVLTVYLLFHPKLPKLDVTKGSLNRINLDPTTFLYNSEMVALIRVTNPNGRVDMRYEYINFKLFFRSDMVATQVLPPFAQRRGNSTDLKVIDMVSNDAQITPLSARLMSAQAINNSIEYQLVGNLRTVARLGATAQIPYWLNVNCQLHFTSPPNGVLHDHKCSSTR